MYKGAKKIKSVKKVGAPPPGYIDNSNFDTLWSVIFTLSPGPDENLELTQSLADTVESLEEPESPPPQLGDPVASPSFLEGPVTATRFSD